MAGTFEGLAASVFTTSPISSTPKPYPSACVAGRLVQEAGENDTHPIISGVQDDKIVRAIGAGRHNLCVRAHGQIATRAVNELHLHTLQSGANGKEFEDVDQTRAIQEIHKNKPTLTSCDHSSCLPTP